MLARTGLPHVERKRHFPIRAKAFRLARANRFDDLLGQKKRQTPVLIERFLDPPGDRSVARRKTEINPDSPFASEAEEPRNKARFPALDVVKIDRGES